VATPFRVVDLANETQVQNAIDWWLEMTNRGGEGMVVKPLDFLTKRAPHEENLDGKNGDSSGENNASTRRQSEMGGWLQPAVKCRGREYLRIIYGPEYTRSENLARLRSRGLGAKRSLALREWSPGLESLQRFIEREPLHRVHECVFGVLALESEPVDPRL
jgi:protein phosphatase